MISEVNATIQSYSFPQQNERTSPCKKSLAITIFDLFKRFAENPIIEIGGRKIWSDNRGRLLDSQSVNLVEITHCSTTVQALLVALFGPQTSYNVMNIVKSSKIKKYSENPNCLKKIESHIHSNDDPLNNNPSSDFYAYVFALFSNPKAETIFSSSHIFLVIQYKDKEGKLNYRLLQSFLQCFDLKTDIDNNSNFFSQTHFDSFLRNFEQFFLFNSWTIELEETFMKFFHTKSSIKIGEPNPYFDIAPFVYGLPFTFNQVLKNDEEFTNLKQTIVFQSIMSKVIV